MFSGNTGGLRGHHCRRCDHCHASTAGCRRRHHPGLDRRRRHRPADAHRAAAVRRRVGAFGGSNDAPVGAPTISGTPTEDQTLTVSMAGVTDADNSALGNHWHDPGAGRLLLAVRGCARQRRVRRHRRLRRRRGRARARPDLQADRCRSRTGAARPRRLQGRHRRTRGGVLGADGGDRQRQRCRR